MERLGEGGSPVVAHLWWGHLWGPIPNHPSPHRENCFRHHFSQHAFSECHFKLEAGFSVDYSGDLGQVLSFTETWES